MSIRNVASKAAAQTAAQCLPETSHNAPKPLHTALYFTTTFARLGLFVIGRSSVQVRSSAPSSAAPLRQQKSGLRERCHPMRSDFVTTSKIALAFANDRVIITTPFGCAWSDILRITCAPSAHSFSLSVAMKRYRRFIHHQYGSIRRPWDLRSACESPSVCSETARL